ncbi:MAG TPA: zinc ribbon domain-containing protein [Blastocatellia bacterium]|jgi:hypothetical protein
MFCPSCGFQYTQKTNYCKRCGESLSLTSMADEPKMGRPRLGIMFSAVAAFGIAGLIAAYNMLDTLTKRGLRGDDLVVPLLMTLMFTGSIAGLLIWQLARLITAYQKSNQVPAQERVIIKEAQVPRLGLTNDPVQGVGEPASVVEHTTRRMADVYVEPKAQG